MTGRDGTRRWKMFVGKFAVEEQSNENVCVVVLKVFADILNRVLYNCVEFSVGRGQSNAEFHKEQVHRHQKVQVQAEHVSIVGEKSQIRGCIDQLFVEFKLNFVRNHFR